MVQEGIMAEPRTDELAAEGELIRLAQQDRTAFGALYDRYVEAVYRFAYHRTCEHAAAQDVTAETFRRALEALPRYQWQGKPFGAWLLRIAQNVARERRRSQQQLPTNAITPDLDEPPDTDTAALDGVIAHEERAALWQLVGALSVDYQRILVWRYAREWDYPTIAAQLGRTPAAAKQLAYRALQALRKQVIASGMWREREQTI